MTSLLQVMRNRALAVLMLGHFSNDMLGGHAAVALSRDEGAVRAEQRPIGLVTLAFTAASSLTQPLFGYFSDTYGKRWFVPATLMWGAVCAASYGFVSSYVMFLVVAATGRDRERAPSTRWGPRTPRLSREMTSAMPP